MDYSFLKNIENKTFNEFVMMLLDHGFDTNFETHANFLKNAKAQYLAALVLNVDNMIFDYQKEVSHETI